MTQWWVAARRPKGLAAMIPWEGLSDFYRDRGRHGGILSDRFHIMWQDRQVLGNQYGKAGRSMQIYPPDGPATRGQEETIEGDLPEEYLMMNRRDQIRADVENEFRDQDFYTSREYRLEDIEVPLLSVANWGGLLLHLRGNVHGYSWAGSKLKFLRFIVGRHDLPFYYDEEVEIQKSFLDAFLKGEDTVGWSVPGKLAPVNITLRKGNVGFNKPEKERTYPKREESHWPIPRTQYAKYFLHEDHSLSVATPQCESKSISYRALGTLEKPQSVQFTTPPFLRETEVTGHLTVHLNVSMTPEESSGQKDIDLFITLRHLDSADQEIFYTGTIGDPVPVCKGWLRVSLRGVCESHPRHRAYLPYRGYLSTDVQPVTPGEVYAVDIELWPTNVVVEEGGRLLLEVSSGDSQGSGIFQHNSEHDR